MASSKDSEKPRRLWPRNKAELRLASPEQCKVLRWRWDGMDRLGVDLAFIVDTRDLLDRNGEPRVVTAKEREEIRRRYPLAARFIK